MHVVAVGQDGGTIVQNVHFALCRTVHAGHFAVQSLLGTLQESMQGLCRAVCWGEATGTSIQVLLSPNSSDLEYTFPNKPNPTNNLSWHPLNYQATVRFKLLRIICHWLDMKDLICNNAIHPWTQTTELKNKLWKTNTSSILDWITSPQSEDNFNEPNSDILTNRAHLDHLEKGVFFY